MMFAQNKLKQQPRKHQVWYHIDQRGRHKLGWLYYKLYHSTRDTIHSVKNGRATICRGRDHENTSCSSRNKRHPWLWSWSQYREPWTVKTGKMTEFRLLNAIVVCESSHWGSSIVPSWYQYEHRAGPWRGKKDGSLMQLFTALSLWKWLMTPSLSYTGYASLISYATAFHESIFWTQVPPNNLLNHFITI